MVIASVSNAEHRTIGIHCLLLFRLQGQFQSFEHAAVGELLQGFVAADDSIWPSWFPDPAANSSWAPTTP